MDTSGIRKGMAVIFLTAFLLLYSLVLNGFFGFKATDFGEVLEITIRTYTLKVMLFSAYCVTNSLMIWKYKSQLELEVLLTGIFSLIFITVLTFLQFIYWVIMTDQQVMKWLINVTLVAFFAIYKNAYIFDKHLHERDN